MRKLSAIVILFLLAALAPSNFALAQTATPAPTPTLDYRAPVPVGAVQMMLLSDPDDVPNGWLFADGSCISRTTYAQLYAVFGTIWDTCDGSTTFGIPDLRGRFPLATMPDAGAPAPHSLGEGGGAESHTLTALELAAHNHGIVDPGHTHPPLSPSTLYWGVGTGTGAMPGGSASRAAGTTGSSTTGISTTNTGLGLPFSIMPPYFALDFYIWSGLEPMPASPAEDVVITVVVVFPTHTNTPTPTPSLTPTSGPSPTATATPSPTGAPGYQLSYTVGGQEVLMDYRVTPGDAFIGGLIFFLCGLVLISMIWYVKRSKA